MPLFTVVLEFDGGTYISQLRAASAHIAAAKYAEEIPNGVIGRLPTRQRLAAALKAERPVAIEGVKKVWCCSASVGTKLALMNIVETAT